MNKLYISDLDGTLLNSEAQISEYAVLGLNKLIKEGLNFTIATARSLETVKHILKDVELDLPLILMNGVIIYSFKDERYIKIENIDIDTSKKIVRIIEHHKISGFMYKMVDDTLITYYESLDDPVLKGFVDERVTKYNKKFYKADSFSDYIDKDIIYFTIIDTYEVIKPIYDEIIRMNVKCSFYQDIYAENLWYFEVISENASKYNAVNFLRKLLSPEIIISFGDNLNDIPLFNASDECYAVENANDELKKIATEIIGSNFVDGVVRFLEKH